MYPTKIVYAFLITLMRVILLDLITLILFGAASHYIVIFSTLLKIFPLAQPLPFLLSFQFSRLTHVNESFGAETSPLRALIPTNLSP
jgi:hypothetical protein